MSEFDLNYIEGARDRHPAAVRIYVEAGIEAIDLLVDEVERLRRQLAELLPLVEGLSEFASPDREGGECAWETLGSDSCWSYQAEKNKAASGECIRLRAIDEHHPSCPVHRALLVMQRVENGEFGEVAS